MRFKRPLVRYSDSPAPATPYQAASQAWDERIGFGSFAVITGDVTQIDLPDKVRSGLMDALHVLRDVEGIAQVRLTEKDVVRHRLVQQIVKAYEKAAEEKAPGSHNHKQTMEVD